MTYIRKFVSEMFLCHKLQTMECNKVVH